MCCSFILSCAIMILFYAKFVVSVSIIKDMERLSNITIYLYSLKPLLYIGIEIHTCIFLNITEKNIIYSSFILYAELNSPIDISFLFNVFHNIFNMTIIDGWSFVRVSVSIIKDMERLSNITIYLYSLKPLLYIGIEIHTN
jgi:hypothetical protein